MNLYDKNIHRFRKQRVFNNTTFFCFMTSFVLILITIKSIQNFQNIIEISVGFFKSSYNENFAFAKNLLKSSLNCSLWKIVIILFNFVVGDDLNLNYFVWYVEKGIIQNDAAEKADTKKNLGGKCNKNVYWK